MLRRLSRGSIPVSARVLAPAGVAAAYYGSKSGDLSKKVLSKDTISASVKNVQYAVRGELVIKAGALDKKLAAGDTSLPFREIVYSNIGNPQQLKQKPVTFFREVLALCDCPALLERPGVDKVFAPDSIRRAKELLAAVDGGTGAYSHSQGIEVTRKAVARFIETRDGFASDPDKIFLTDGASPGVQNVLNLTIRGPKDGIMIPIPQYPLYSASIALFGGTQVPYYLDEAAGWGLSVQELQRSIKAARGKGIEVRALCIINPGNPTGAVLSHQNIADVIQFAAKERLVLMADEVYQENIYGEKPFHSFKKVLMEQQPAVRDAVELFSFHSTSKGLIGECGRRGGYYEAWNVDPDVLAELYKLKSVSLCPNVSGQVMMDLMVDPPRPGDASYDEFKRESNDVYESLKRRAVMVVEALNKLEGVTCNPAEGAMYAFPKISLPKNAIQHAKEIGKAPDAMYCLELLDATGLCVVPGSGFGQVDGTWHFRTTFLPQENQIKEVLQRLNTFHADFLKRYGGL